MATMEVVIALGLVGGVALIDVLKKPTKVTEKVDQQASRRPTLFQSRLQRLDNPQLFRVLFYLVMAYNWFGLDHSPCNEWRQAFRYYHTIDMCPPNEEWSAVLKYGGSVVAVAAACGIRPAMLLFMVLQNAYVFSYITNFVNHDYLFGLLAVLVAAYEYSDTNRSRQMALLQALRGQICVVYFYAALWKAITRSWLDGTICRGIFLSFEEQGVASGVAWSKLEQQIPYLFVQIAWCGLLLDALLAVVLLFWPIGHWVQQVGVVFHGFTALTMAQRIGYSFPAAMLASGLLFKPADSEKAMDMSEDNDNDDEDNDKNESSSSSSVPMAMSHAQWMWKHKNSRWKRFPFVTCWLLLQWLLPARMPFISKGLYMYTGEGYRFSWTMMLHGRESFAGVGLNFFTLRPRCGGHPFPSPPHYPQHLDARGFPIHQRIGMRGLAGLNMFPRQLPRIANNVVNMIGPACKTKEGIQIYGSMFVTVDGGPFHRLVDPQQDLGRTHKALMDRTFLPLLLGTMFDKAPVEEEFILNDVGSYWRTNSKSNLSSNDGEGWVYMVDRLECLKADPIGLFARAIELVVLESPSPLLLETCNDLEQLDCTQQALPASQDPIQIPPVAVVKIHSAEPNHQDATRACRSSKEDVLLKFRPGMPWGGIASYSAAARPDIPLSSTPSHPNGHKVSWKDTPETTQMRELLFQGKEEEFRSLIQTDPGLVHMRSADGRGPVWWAVEFNRPNILQYLIAMGVDTTQKDSFGLTPPQLLQKIASQQGHQ